jgi:hypothetical protein
MLRDRKAREDTCKKTRQHKHEYCCPAITKFDDWI